MSPCRLLAVGYSVGHGHTFRTRSMVKAFLKPVAVIPKPGRLLRQNVDIPSTSRVYHNGLDTAGAVHISSLEPSQIVLGPNSRSNSRLILLRAALAGESDHAHTPNTIKSLYTSLTARKMEHHLTAMEFSTLLNLFGFLSIPTPRPPSAFIIAPITKLSLCSDVRNWWTVVLRIGRDKMRCHKNLTDQDKFWMMRAELAQTSTTSEDTGAKGSHSQRCQSFHQASKYYDAISRHSSDPELHLPYLRRMSSSENKMELGLAVSKLCEVLLQHFIIPQRLQRFLWEFLIEHLIRFSPEMKNQMLSSLLSRVETIFSTPIQQGMSPQPSDDYDFCSRATFGKVFTSAFFPQYSAGVSFPATIWANEQIRTMLSPLRPVEDRWDSLMLLALANASNEQQETDIAIYNKARNALDSEWRTICILTAIERAIPDAKVHNAQDLKGLVRSVWRDWAFERLKRPPYISRAIIAAFLRISTTINDVRLVEACRDYSFDYSLWLMADSHRPSVKTLQTQMIVSSALIGSGHWQNMLRAPCDIVSMPSKYSSKLGNAAIYRLLGPDVNIAYKVYKFCLDNHIEVSRGVILALGVTLSRLGNFRQVLPLLQDPTFSVSQTERLWTTVVSPYMQRRSQFIDRELLDAITSVLLRLYKGQHPPLHFRPHFQYILTLIEPNAAAKITLSVIRSSSGYFQNSFFSQLLSALSHRGRYRVCMRLLKSMERHDIPVNYFARFLVLRFSRANAHKLARRAYAVSRRASSRRSVVEKLLQASAFRLRMPHPVRSLAVISILRRHGLDSIASVPIRLGMNILVRSRRLYAARVLFADLESRIDSRFRTQLGNIIIRGALLQRSSTSLQSHPYRGARVMRRVLNLLSILKERHGFVQDRVTNNIILAAMLQWQSKMNALEVRELFQQMLDKQGNFSLQIGKTHLPDVGSLPPTIEPISFPRHLQPMYKMFIKAFHMRGDRRSAEAVIGILKAEQRRYREHLESLNLLRSWGRWKKAQRERSRNRNSASHKYSTLSPGFFLGQ